MRRRSRRLLGRLPAPPPVQPPVHVDRGRRRRALALRQGGDGRLPAHPPVHVDRGPSALRHGGDGGQGEEFETVQTLGQGTGGPVLRARHRTTGQEVVLKPIPRTTNKPGELTETDVLTHMKPFCDPFFSCLVSPQQQQQPTDFLATTYVPNSLTLRNWLEEEQQQNRHSHPPLPACRVIVLNLIRAVRALHDHGMAHRDIKPENVLLVRPDFHVRLIDYGISCIGDRCVGETQSGTALYTSPEIQYPDTQKTARHFTILDFQAADWWAVGLTIAELLHGGQHVFYTWRTHYLRELPPTDSLLSLPTPDDRLLETLRRFLRQYRYLDTSGFALSWDQTTESRVKQLRLPECPSLRWCLDRSRSTP